MSDTKPCTCGKTPIDIAAAEWNVVPRATDDAAADIARLKDENRALRRKLFSMDLHNQGYYSSVILNKLKEFDRKEAEDE